MKRIIGMILAAAMIMPHFCTAYAKVDISVYLNEGFGSYRTNAYAITGYDITGTAKIAEDGVKDKALYLKGGATANIEKSFNEKITGDFVMSFDIKAEGSAHFLKLGMINGTNRCQLLGIDEGKLLLSDAKLAGRVSRIYSNVAIVYSSADKRVSVYVNGRETVSSWKPFSTASAYTGFYINKLSGADGVYIDNLKLYSGLEIENIKNDTSYSAQKDEDLHIEQDVGDYTYFHSMCISNRAGAYIHFELGEKTNKIICERYDYMNPEKGDRIILQKITDDDVYFDVNTTQRQQGNDPSKRYKHFMLKTDFMITKTNLKSQFFMVRDSTTTSVRYDETLATLNGATLTASNGMVLSSSINANTWYNYMVYVDVENSKVDFYLDGKLVAEGVPLGKNIKNIDKIRASITTGGPGELQVRNCEFTGMEKPIVKGNIERTSVFPDDKLISDYLNTKYGALHRYSKMIYADGKKQPMSAAPVYDDGELYVAASDLAKVVKADVHIKDGKVMSGELELCAANGELVPTKAAVAALGLQLLDDNSGMLLVDDEPFNFDMSMQKEQWYDTYYESIMKDGAYYGNFTELTQLQQLNFYLLYDRPDADKLSADFNANNADTSAHPRLLVNSDRIAQIKEMAKTDSYLKLVIDKFLALADAAMNEDIMTYKFNDNDTMRTNEQAERFETRIKKLAFAYLLTDDTKYAERAWKELDSVSKFPDFNFSHVIDTGMWNSGIALGYDWIYNYLNDQQREQLKEAIVRLGIKPINRAYYAGMPSNGAAGVNSGGGIQATNAFVRWKSNYGAFVNGGVIIAALAVAEYAPELCFDTIEKALHSWEYPLMVLAPDGVWLEGGNYWPSVMNDMAYCFGALDSVLGTTYKLTDAPGVEYICRNLIGFTSPNQEFSFGDDQPTTDIPFAHESYSFFSYFYNQKDVAMMRRIKIDDALRVKYGNKMKAADVSALDIAYYLPDVTEENLNTVDRVTVMKGMESFVVHENFHDPNGLFFASAGGPTTFYHEHNDGGDFTFDLNGESWAYIIGAGNYNVGHYTTRYSSRAEGHNTLTINPDENLSQQPGSFAEIIASGESDYGAYAVYDMTSLYKAAVDMKRGFYIGDNFSSVTVRDEMQFNAQSTGYWFMHTDADATLLDKDTVILSKNGKSITVKVDVDKASKYEVKIMPATALPTSPKVEGDAGYPNLRKIAVYFEGVDVDIDVCMAEKVSSEEPKPISEWKAPEYTAKDDSGSFAYSLYANGVECMNKSKVPVVDSANMPEVTAVPEDPTKTVTIEPLEGDANKLKLTVTNADASQKRIYVIAYSDKGIDVVNAGYNILPITNFSVSSEPQPANIGSNMFDDDMLTRWTTFDKGAEAIIDLGEVKPVDAITAAFWRGNTRSYSFEICVSTDGVNYTSVNSYKSSGNSEDYEIFRFGARNARYIKLIGNGNPDNTNTNILELKALKSK